MINLEEVRLLVKSIKQHSGTEVPTDSALAALYMLEQYRYRTLQSNLQTRVPSTGPGNKHPESGRGFVNATQHRGRGSEPLLEKADEFRFPLGYFVQEPEWTTRIRWCHKKDFVMPSL
jgi:hypothetical protein